MYFYTWVLAITIALTSSSAFAKWDEERDMTTNGREELVYYSKMNAQGQKLVFDNKDEVLKKLFLAKEVEVSVRYGREPGLSVFMIK